MAGGRQKCNGCGTLLLVPPEAKAMRCALCQTVTTVRPLDPYNRTQDPVRQAASWMKGFMSTVSHRIDSVATSINSYPSNSYGNYAYHPPVSLPLSFPSVHGKRRALLCGLCYRSKRYELKGSINDVNCMRYFLVEKLGFPPDAILILTENERDPYRIPTRQNIRNALKWLVQGCQPGDSLVFHYSGHGSQQPNINGEEIDGFDETLCPLDYETEGMILDDEINATIVKPLPKGTTLHAIMDACHSGTILDLPYLCRMNKNGYYSWENHSPNKGTSGGLAVSFSACDDHQTSADTSALSGNTMTGAMTYSFIQAAQSSPGLTYGSLLNAMRVAIREANAGIRCNGPISSFLKKVLFNGLSQDFYEDLFEELSKYGEIESLNICDNLADHMVGNVYVQFREEEHAANALQNLTGRFYAGRPIIVDFSPVTDFREATCRQYEEDTCNRGGYCNFMHLKKISRDLRRHLFGRYRRRHSRSRSPYRHHSNEERSHVSRHGRRYDDRDHYCHDERIGHERGRNTNPGGRRNKSSEREGSAERRAKIEQWNKERDQAEAGHRESQNTNNNSNHSTGCAQYDDQNQPKQQEGGYHC
ncbi:Metacaspase-1 [Thalictrum thalictroides]|uniref:Metacaspase-1 n=1 Tax=Thalictrum thalictroides TaxID=46969 RepID=A0A7J6VEQ8_THATH|nr:Metacaspase-1 [Thalictrum thalictroides]